jgi:lysophospholipase L1-like esterase
MKKAILSLLASLCIIAIVNAQNSMPKPGDADFPTPTPSDRHTQKVAAVRSHNYDLLMIGDSITHTMGDSGGEWEPLKSVWQTHFAPRNAINLGYSGYRTENVLWNLQNGELDMQKSPKVAVVLIGTNNTDDTNYPTVHTPEQIFDGTKAIVETIRKKHPITKILVLSIFPRGGAKEVTNFTRRYTNSDQCVETCRTAGELTKKLADNKHVYWANLNSVFFRKDGTMNTDLIPDLVHPNAEGAEAWANALEPILAKLMGDKVIKSSQQIALEKAPADVRELANKRIMVLGDSITQDGRYVNMMEYLLQKQHPFLDFNIFSVGLASETASGLSEIGHPFPRPDIRERLNRALIAVRPEVVIACYGMNDGIYQPYDATRMKAFQIGITSMVKQCQAVGARVILVTPPAFDITQFGENITKDGEKFTYGKPYAKYDDVLAAFAKWEVKTKPSGVEVIDLHTSMELIARNAKKSSLELYRSGDGIHPTDLGHLFMATTILEGLGIKQPKEDLRVALEAIQTNPLYDLVSKHRATRSEGWLPYIGYTRGGMTKSTEIVPTEAKAAELQVQINRLRRGQ